MIRDVSRIRRLQHSATLEKKRLDKKANISKTDIEDLRDRLNAIIELANETYIDKLVRVSTLILGPLLMNKLTEQIGIVGTGRCAVCPNNGMRTEAPC